MYKFVKRDREWQSSISFIGGLEARWRFLGQEGNHRLSNLELRTWLEKVVGKGKTEGSSDSWHIFLH